MVTDHADIKLFHHVVQFCDVSFDGHIAYLAWPSPYALPDRGHSQMTSFVSNHHVRIHFYVLKDHDQTIEVLAKVLACILRA